MVESYRQALGALVARRETGADSAIDIKHFFSGAAAYADGHIFATLTPVGFALKLPETCREALLEEGATPLRYFAKGPIKKDYIVIPDTIVRDGRVLGKWIDESLRFCRHDP